MKIKPEFKSVATLDTPIESIVLEWTFGSMFLSSNPPKAWVVEILCQITDRTPPEFYAVGGLTERLIEENFTDFLNVLANDDEFGRQIEIA